MTVVYGKPRRAYRLSQKLAEGGEGEVYRVEGQPDILAKLYFPNRVPDKAKLAWMVANPPEDPTIASRGHISIAWPRALLYDANGGFTGFAMPFIDDTIPIVRVLTPKLRTKWAAGFNWRYLHVIARNFASAVSALHAKNYVVGDINDGNVVVSRNALVTLLDTDSFQVTAISRNKPKVFVCPVGKPEYTPPELQGQAFDQVVRTPDHDAFAMAVLIFQLLMDGTHPFKALFTGPGDPPSLEEKIVGGLFPYQTPPPSHIAPPKNSPPFANLHPDIAFLFRRCFVDGHRDPSRRPTADEWTDALEKAEQALVDCPRGHVYSNHLKSCPWCAAKRGSQTSLPPIKKAIPAPPRRTIPPPPRTTLPPPPLRRIPVPTPTPTPRPVSQPIFTPLPPPPVATSGANRRRTAVIGGGVVSAIMGIALLVSVFNVGGAGKPLPTPTVAQVAIARSTATARPTSPPRPTSTPTPGPDVLAAGCWTSAQVRPALTAPGTGRTYEQWSFPPARVINSNNLYVATIETDQGNIAVELLVDEAPTTVNNFVCLARAGFFDNMGFYRIVPGSVLQTGDPTGTGRGSPGYQFADEPVIGDYTRGTLAMVNTGPDTNGSQFFLFLDNLSSRLPKRYTIFGRVTGGLAIADKIGADPGSTVVIKKVVISEETA